MDELVSVSLSFIPESVERFEHAFLETVESLTCHLATVIPLEGSNRGFERSFQRPQVQCGLD